MKVQLEVEPDALLEALLAAGVDVPDGFALTGVSVTRSLSDGNACTRVTFNGDVANPVAADEPEDAPDPPADEGDDDGGGDGGDDDEGDDDTEPVEPEPETEAAPEEAIVS